MSFVTLLWLFWQILISYCKFLMPRPLKWTIPGAHTIILSKNIQKSQRQIMCGSNLYGLVQKVWSYLNKIGKVQNSFGSIEGQDQVWTLKKLLALLHARLKYWNCVIGAKIGVFSPFKGPWINKNHFILSLFLPFLLGNKIIYIKNHWPKSVQSSVSSGLKSTSKTPKKLV